jgi:hypothetical protein
MNEIRIPVKPQRWLWITNVLIQPPIALLCGWAATDPEGGLGLRVFMLALAATCGLLFVFALLVLSRTLGRTFEIVLDERALHVPNVIRGITEEMRLASITKATIDETNSNGVSFFSLRLEASDRKPVVVMSQFVGPAAFHELVDALRARGVGGIG